MAAAPINRRTRLSDQTYAVVRAKIISGEMTPGAKIAEAELATGFGVSRTPLREALLRLSDEGLVAIFPQSGSFVAPINMDAVTEAQFVREHLECAVIRETAERIAPSGLAVLRRNLSEQQEADRENAPDRFYKLDEALHAAFAELAGRAGVWRTIQQGKAHLDRVRMLSLPVANHVPHLIRQHRAIVDALAAHDPAAAEATLRRHLREVFATVEQLGLAMAQAAPMLKQARSG